MATRIVNLNAYRRATAATLPGHDRGEIRTGTRKNADVRMTRNKAAAPVLQIPTAANKKQRCKAAAALHRDDCQRVVSNAFARTVHEPITGAIAITATDLKGGDFNVRLGGVYSDDAEAALSTLGCLVEYFQERALKERNKRAMATAQPTKRPAFAMAL